MASLKQYIVKRSGYTIVTLFIISLLIFFIVNTLPGNVAEMVLGQYGTPESVAALEQEYGLNQPLFDRYVGWLSGFVLLDWGESISRNEPILDLVVPRLINSLQLTVVTLLIVFILGIILGVLASVMHGGILDFVIVVSSYVGASVPVFVTGVLMLLLFSGPVFSLLPPGGYASLNQSIGKWATHMVLPSITLSTALLAHVVRQTRSEMIETLRTDYVRAARLGGIKERRVILQHALRNSLLPTLTLIPIYLGWLMGGLVVVEKIFAYPGLGRLVVNAIQSRDLFLVQDIVMVIALLYLLGNFVVDILYTYLDPTIQYN